MAFIIAAHKHLDIISSIEPSVKLSLANIRVITPAVLLWLLANTAMVLLATYLLQITPIILDKLI